MATIIEKGRQYCKPLKKELNYLINILILFAQSKISSRCFTVCILNSKYNMFYKDYKKSEEIIIFFPISYGEFFLRTHLKFFYPLEYVLFFV